MSRSDLIDLAVEIRAETANAWLVHDGHRDVWIPKSQCEAEEIRSSTIPRQRMFTLTLPEWLAKAKELI